MQRGTSVLLATLAAGVAFLASAGPAPAQTDAEIACRAAISTNLSRLLGTALKDVTRCHGSRSRGKLPLSVNCNDAVLIPGNRSLAAYDAASAAILAACPDSLSGVLASYARCPSPHSTIDDDGATDGIDTFQEATNCLLNLTITMVNGAAATVLGQPEELLGSSAVRCQKSVAKAFRKRLLTFQKVRNKCQKEADRNGNGLSYSCGDWDDGKIAANQQKFNDAIARSCDLTQDELVPLHSCGQSVAQFQQCAGGLIANALGAGLVAQAFELPPTCALGHVRFFVSAGYGSRRTPTGFDLGHNGQGQDTDLVDGFQAAADLSCNDDCTNCAVTLDPIKDSGASFCRCTADMTQHCDTINGPDADDCGGGHCDCLFGPPLPLSSGGSPVCILNRFTQDLEGVADGGSGVATITIRNAAVVHTGMSQTHPCPLCLGDTSLNDGTRTGTCLGGPRDGLDCDLNGFSPDFGPVSYDCPPDSGANISGSGLQVDFALTSVGAPAIGTDLFDGLNPAYCLQCSGDTQVACRSNADCTGIGTCTANTGATARANACDDGICTASESSGDGTCEANDPDVFCNGVLRASGRGLLPCNVQADCDALDPGCPGGDCGNCDFAQERACLPDPFDAVGSLGVFGSVDAGGIYGADMVSTMCIPPTASPGVNESIGLPGPGRLSLHFAFDGRCGSDESLRFQPPAGSNCP